MFTTQKIQNVLKTTGSAVLSIPLRIPAAMYAYVTDSVKIIQNQAEIVLIYSSAFMTSFGGIGSFISMFENCGANHGIHNLFSQSITHFDEHCRAVVFPRTEDCLDYLAQNISVNTFISRQWIEDYTLTPTFPDKYLIGGIVLGASFGLWVGVGCTRGRSKEYGKKIPEITIEKLTPQETQPHLGMASLVNIPVYFWLLLFSGTRHSEDHDQFFLKYLLKHVGDYSGCVVNIPLVPELTCQDNSVKEQFQRAATKFARKATLGLSVNPLAMSMLLAASGATLIYSFEKCRKKKEHKLEEAQVKYLETYKTRLR